MNVITAGGAGNSASKKKRKNKKTKRKNANNNAQSPTSTTEEVPTTGESSVSLLKDDPIVVQVGNDSNEVTTSSTKQSSEELQNNNGQNDAIFALELEPSLTDQEDSLNASENAGATLNGPNATSILHNSPSRDKLLREVDPVEPLKIEDLYQEPPESSKTTELFWLFFCFLGIMASFVCYGLLLEYTTSGGRKLHELSFLFVTSGLYTLTAAAGRYVRAEKPTTIPPARFAILGLTSMGSTFCSVRSLRYVIHIVALLYFLGDKQTKLYDGMT